MGNERTRKEGRTMEQETCSIHGTRMVSYRRWVTSEDVATECPTCSRIEKDHKAACRQEGMLRAARATSRPVWVRHNVGTVPIDGTIEIAFPDGRFEDAFVYWNGENKLASVWETAVDFWKSSLIPEECRTMARAGGF